MTKRGLWRETLETVRGFSSIRMDWNDPDSWPVSRETVDFTVKLLKALRKAKIPIPRVEPIVNGDVLLEWYKQDEGITVLICAPDDIKVWLPGTSLEDWSDLEYRNEPEEFIIQDLIDIFLDVMEVAP